VRFAENMSWLLQVRLKMVKYSQYSCRRMIVWSVSYCSKMGLLTPYYYVNLELKFNSVYIRTYNLSWVSRDGSYSCCPKCLIFMPQFVRSHFSIFGRLETTSEWRKRWCIHAGLWSESRQMDWLWWTRACNFSLWAPSIAWVQVMYREFIWALFR
jgi:hypothetical protein